MTTRAVTIAVFGLLFCVGVGLEAAARSGRKPLPSFGSFVRGLLSTRLGRLSVLAVWAWLGWHFLAR